MSWFTVLNLKDNQESIWCLPAQNKDLSLPSGI